MLGLHALSVWAADANWLSWGILVSCPFKSCHFPSPIELVTAMNAGLVWCWFSNIMGIILARANFLFASLCVQCCLHLSRPHATSRSGQARRHGWSVRLKDIRLPKWRGRKMAVQISLPPESAACVWCLMTMSSSSWTWSLRIWACTAARQKTRRAWSPQTSL